MAGARHRAGRLQRSASRWTRVAAPSPHDPAPGLAPASAEAIPGRATAPRSPRWVPVQAALLDRVLLPPPAPGPGIPPGLNRSRAGGTADGWVTTVVERVIGDLVPADVLPDPVCRPGRERRQLRDPPMGLVQCHHRRDGPGR